MLELKNLSILIVDDVKSMRSIAQKMLRNLKIGKVLHTAQNGMEGLNILHSINIDLIILDWKMPIMSGAQLLENIRQDSLLRDIPVLMVTGEAHKEIVLDVAEIEVEGYLLKPLTPAILEDKIKTIIDHINNPDMATIHINKAREFEEQDDLTSALAHMQHAVELKPGASRILRKLGLLYQKTGDKTLTQKWFLKAVQANPRDAVTKHLLAEMFWKEQDYIKAGQYYLEVLTLTRKFSERAVILGERLLKNNKNELAKQLFKKIISTSIKTFHVKEKIADLCMEHGELEYSHALFQTLIQEHPSKFDLVYKSGVVCEMMKEMDKALECFLIVEQHQGSRVDVKLKLAQIYYDKKKTIKADNYLLQVLRKNPKNKEALALRRLL
ncbi:MAG: response regulator [Desulfobacula sp.]|nr:response regulator [Desulfobacula sp.]